MSDELQWHGDAIIARIERATIAAIDETTGGCAAIAKQLVHVDTHDLQNSLGAIPARVEGDTIAGAFGSLNDPGYALEQEFISEPYGRAYMRPAANQEFPKLHSRIQRRLGGR